MNFQNMMQMQPKISEEEYEGRVNWFNEIKGFGFITPNTPLKNKNGKSDIFVHISSLTKNNVKLYDNDKVLFNIEESYNGKFSAINIKKLKLNE